MNSRSLLTTTLALLIGMAAQAKSNSFVCAHPDVDGGWGALSLGCDADQFGDLTRIQYIYPKFVFDRRIKDDSGEKAYITNMNSIIRKVAHDYYVKRVPDAKPEVLKAWMRAAVAVGAHESMLSHYRISADGRYKLMTGDHLVSHGVMQVNQNFHANQELDSSFDLVGNIVGALDTYFLEWNSAIKEDCYAAANGKKASLDLMLSNRARSAYSAYNGGPGRLCRYIDKKSHYKQHDDDFLLMYRDQPWMKYVTDPNRLPSINTKCIVDGDDLCAMAKPARTSYIETRPLLLADGKTCVTADGTNFTCATDMRIFSCLAKVNPDILDNDPLTMGKLPKTAKVSIVKDREPLCMKAVHDLYKVGTMVVLQKELVMRDSVGGSPVGSTRAGRMYQVEDYDLRLGGKTERYYKIKTSHGSGGWVYGGTDTDHEAWIRRATAESVADKAKPAAQPKADNDGDDTAAVLPVKGSVVEIIKDDGIVLRETVDEAETKPGLDQLSKGARLTVEEVQVKGTENRLYLKVTEGGKSGWIYVGRTFPDSTVNQWIKLWQ